jgi:hypothetical protein
MPASRRLPALLVLASLLRHLLIFCQAIDHERY